MEKNGKFRIILDLDRLSEITAANVVRNSQNRIFAVRTVDLMRDMGFLAGNILKKLGAPRVWVGMGPYGRLPFVHHVAATLRSASVDIVTVHASVGVDVMKAVRDEGVKVYADTIPASSDPERIKKSYGRERPEDVVIAFAEMAEEAEAAGVVCLPHDIPLLKQLLVRTEIVAVDVRPAGSPETGRKRVGDLSMAVRHGADRLVIGGELIAEAPDPVVALQKIEEEIKAALRAKEEK